MAKWGSTESLTGDIEITGMASTGLQHFDGSQAAGRIAAINIGQSLNVGGAYDVSGAVSPKSTQTNIDPTIEPKR